MSVLRKTRSALVAAALLAGAVFVALYLVERRRPPTTPTDLVPTSWEASRSTPMHAVHIGKGKVACSGCHSNGFAEKPSETSCARCHEKQAARAHHGDERSPTTCLSCHAFAAGKRVSGCVDCHGKTSDVPAAAAPARAAHDLAQHVSRGAACNACHAMHGEKGKTRSVLPDCTACHTNTSARHGGASASHAAGDAGLDSFDAAVERFAADARAAAEMRDGGIAPAVASGRGEHSPGAVCTTCHAPHTEASRARESCAECHADHRGALASSSHRACTTCHAPHAPGAARGSCKSCHGGKQVVAQSRVPAHAACESCHDPHRPSAAPEQACARCHDGLSPKHPAQTSVSGRTSTCTGCHSPHGPDSPTAAHPSSAAACSSCHTKARDEHAFHAAGGKTSCTSCHSTHEFATAMKGSAACARCHGDEAKRVEPRSGHAACASCHADAHAPAKKAACSTCHAQEAATAQRGHAACTSCHDSHSGSLGTHAECTSCHSNKTPASKALHTSLPGGCGSCHRPHGPQGIASPPACTTCHTPGKTSGLHAVGAHAASCASCHTSHGSPRSDRATCTTSCHVDRRSHQPEAQVCKGCHMFKR